MANKFVLYNYWRSSCSWRIRAVLEMKNIPYEYRAVNLLKGEQNSNEFRRLNPMGMVPTLQFETKDGRTESIYETMAIVDLLEHFYPSPSVYPKDPVQRAKVIAFAELICSGIQPLQNLGPLQKVEAETGSKEKSNEWAKYWIAKKFEMLEKLVTTTSGKYTFGDELTLADICLVPQIANAHRFKVDMDQYPTLKRLNEFLLTVDPIAKSKPENQPDKPE